VPVKYEGVDQGRTPMPAVARTRVQRCQMCCRRGPTPAIESRLTDIDVAVLAGTDNKMRTVVVESVRSGRQHLAAGPRSRSAL